MILQVKQVQLVHGVMVGGSVRQSLAVEDGSETPQYGGVFRVKGVAISEYGLVVDTGPTGKTLIPWHLVASCVVVDDNPAPAAEVIPTSEEVASVRVQSRAKLPARG